MKYCNLNPAIEAYAQGRNVTAVLRELSGEQNNTKEIIEIAYDLQGGSYIEMVGHRPSNGGPIPQNSLRLFFLLDSK